MSRKIVDRLLKNNRSNFISIKDAAPLLINSGTHKVGVSESWVKRLIEKKTFKNITRCACNHAWFIPISSIEDYNKSFKEDKS